MPFRESPAYNDRRRSISSVRSLQHSNSSHDRLSIASYGDRPSTPRRRSVTSHDMTVTSYDQSPYERAQAPSRRNARPRNGMTSSNDAVTSQFGMMTPLQRSRSMPGVNGDVEGDNSPYMTSQMKHFPSLGSNLSELSSLADQSFIQYDSESPPSLSLYSAGSSKSFIVLSRF